MTAEQAFGEMVESLMKRMGNTGAGCRVCIGTVKEVDERKERVLLSGMMLRN